MKRHFLKSIVRTLSFVLLSFFLFGFMLHQNKTEQGLYVVSLELAEAKMKVGKNTMKLFVGERRSKTPKDKLDIEIVPWMPSHEHGSSELAVVRPLGNGLYSIEGLNLTMTGDWEIYVRINQGRNGEDTAVFNVSVVK